MHHIVSWWQRQPPKPLGWPVKASGKESLYLGTDAGWDWGTLATLGKAQRNCFQLLLILQSQYGLMDSMSNSKCTPMVCGDLRAWVLVGESLSPTFSLSSWWLGLCLPKPTFLFNFSISNCWEMKPSAYGNKLKKQLPFWVFTKDTW